MQADKKVKVMIGSDVKFTVILSDSPTSTTNIQSVDAYFVHKDLRRQSKKDKAQFKFLRRYPIEPCVNDIKSTICCLNNPGIYGYNTKPVGICAPVYAGFGVEPFDPNNVTLKSAGVVKAAVYYTAQRDTVEIYFPGLQQKILGEYDLVINARVYDPNFSFDHSKMVAISYEELVELNDSTDGNTGTNATISYDGDITIDDPTVELSSDNYVQSGQVNNGILTLDMSNGSDVNINLDGSIIWN